jgi:hypothetical protein
MADSNGNEPLSSPNSTNVSSFNFGPSSTQHILHQQYDDLDNIDTQSDLVEWQNPAISELSEADRAKIEYLKDVQSTIQTSEAVELVKGFMKGQLTFIEVAEKMPAVFMKAPYLIERFLCLTNLPAHQRIIDALSSSVSSLAMHISNVPSHLRLSLCQEVASLIIYHRLPDRHSPTREFVFYACQHSVPSFLELPHVNRAPQLRSIDSDVRSPPTQSHATSSGANVMREYMDVPGNLHTFKPTPLSPSKSGSGTHPSQSHCGPSYTQRPSSYVPPACSSRDALGNSVLNDYYHCAGSGSEGSSQDNIRNPHQEALFRLEEDALCIDILIGRAQSTVRALAQIGSRLSLLAEQHHVFLVNVHGNKIRATTTQEVINHSLLPFHIETFRLVAKSRTAMVTADPMTHFQADPHKFISEMTRLCMFQADEYVRTRSCFGKLWKQVFARHYIQTLDHRVYRMKNDDKHMSNPKAILSQLNLQYHEAMVAGRESATDFLQALDFAHFKYNLLPELAKTKSERYHHENENKKKKKKKKNNNGSSEMESDSPDGLLNLVPIDVQQIIDDDLLKLLVTGGERVLSHADNSELSSWLKDTLRYILRIPEAAKWAPANASSQPPIPNIFCGPMQFYIVIRMYHTLHQRLRLAYYLAHKFDSKCWDFSVVQPPAQKSNPSEEDLPVFHSLDDRSPPPTITDQVAVNPSSSYVELSTMFLDTKPDYTAQWEAEYAPVARLTRAGAISSSGLLLGGPPPTQNTTVYHTLLRQAAQLRNTPANAKTPNGLLDGSGFTPDDEVHASLPPLNDPALMVPNDERYQVFLELVYDILSGRIEPSSFDLAIFKLLGPESFPLYTNHRLITNLVSQVRLLMTQPGRRIWYDIWAEHTKSLLLNPPRDHTSISSSISRYLARSYDVADGHKFIEFRMSSLGTLTYKVHQQAPPVPPPTSRIAWETYIKSWNSTKLDGIDLTQRKVFLRRNIATQLPQDLQREPIVGRAHSWDLSLVLHQLSSNFVNGPIGYGCFEYSTWKLIREAFSLEWSVRKNRKIQPPQTSSKPPSVSDKSPLHRVLFGLISRHSVPEHVADIQQELGVIEKILQTERDRPDVVVVEAAPVDQQISLRVHLRKRPPAQNNEMGSSEPNGNHEDSEGEEGEKYSSENESADGSGSLGGSPPDGSNSESEEPAPYQMQVD